MRRTDYKTTINHDLQGIQKLISQGSSSPDFNSTAVFSIFRDVCLMLYEANKVFRLEKEISSDFKNMDIIKNVRHKVKTNQGIKNREIFNRLLKNHIDVFGNDIDNLGFYLEEDMLVGSTLFPTFVFADTPLSNKFDKESVYNFSIIVGSMMGEIIRAINNPITLDSKPMITNDNNNQFTLKDIWDKQFFKEDITYNVFLTRLVLNLNELTTCIWMEKNLDYTYHGFNFDKYILLRFTSIKLFEIMRDLLDLKQRLPQHWSTFKLVLLDNVLEEYTKTHQNVIKTLRDMLHYNNKGVNFYDYIITKNQIKPNYVDDLIVDIFNSYITPIRKSISDAINIQSIRSMDDNEKIQRRLRNMFP